MTTDRLTEAAADYLSALGELQDRRAELADAIRAAVAEGMSEVEAAERAGVSRMTVRAWLGKGKKG